LEQGEPLLASTGPETRQTTMEVDSLEQDNSLRDYWKKKGKKKERKRKEAKGGSSASRVTDTNHDGLVDKSSGSPDSPCLTSTTSPDGETNHKEQFNTSEQITTTEEKSDISSPDYLRDFNALYSDLTPGNLVSVSPVDTSRDEIMESNTSTNQEDSGQQDAGIDHLRLSDDISVPLEDNAVGEQVNTEERSNPDQPKQNKSKHIKKERPS
jgi:hypothetical protein